MKFVVDPKIFNDFPNVNIAVIVAKGIDNGNSSDGIRSLIQKEAERIRSNYDLETLGGDPKIAVWRAAYKKFGAKSEYRSSVENLYRLILKGVDLRQINPLVGIYNLICLKYMFPVGGEDLDKIKGNLQLTYATGDEPAGLLLGEEEPRSIYPGEVIYKDDEGVVCRRWNWKEAERTMLTSETKAAVIVVEGIGDEIQDRIKQAAEELALLVTKHCDAECRSFIVNPSSVAYDLTPTLS